MLGGSGRRRSEHSRGQALVEFALLAPMYFVLVFGLIDVGEFAQHGVALTSAARSGARYGSMHATTWSVADPAPPNTIQGEIQLDQGVQTLANTDAAIAITYWTSAAQCGHYLVAGAGSYVSDDGTSQASCTAAGNYIDVKVTYSYSPIALRVIPGFTAAVTVTREARMVILS